MKLLTTTALVALLSAATAQAQGTAPETAAQPDITCQQFVDADATARIDFVAQLNDALSASAPDAAASSSAPVDPNSQAAAPGAPMEGASPGGASNLAIGSPVVESDIVAACADKGDQPALDVLKEAQSQ
jgi:hypothetical protein